MHNAEKFSTRPILVTGFVLIILLTASLTFGSAYYLVSYGSNLTRAINYEDLKQEQTYAMRTAVRQRSLDLFAMLNSTDPIDQDKYYELLREQGSAFLRAVTSLQQHNLSPDEKQQLDVIIHNANITLEHIYNTIDLMFSSKKAAARKIVMQKIMPQFNNLISELDQLIATQERLYHSTVLGSSRKFNSAINILIPLGSITILAVILITIFVSNKINQSITSLGRFTDKLEMLEKREHLILQGLFDAVITTDDAGYIQDFNAPAERMFGYTEEEIFGCNVKKLMPEAYSKMHDKFLNNYTSTGQTKVMGKGRALLGKRKDGSVFPIDVALTEFKLEEQRIFIGTIRDITQQKEYENALLRSQQDLEERVQQRTKELYEVNEKLEQLASYDTLTGLANRYLFTERFKQELAYARRHQTRLALLYMDLDGFKQINDNMGHKSGDILLKTVAERLHSVVREEDTLARLGGDEFALIANHINVPADAVLIARKIITAINQPILLNNQPIDIGISIGISCFPNNGSDMETLLHYADTAMYQAKQQGKNRYFSVSEPA